MANEIVKSMGRGAAYFATSDLENNAIILTTSSKDKTLPRIELSWGSHEASYMSILIMTQNKNGVMGLCDRLKVLHSEVRNFSQKN